MREGGDRVITPVAHRCCHAKAECFRDRDLTPPSTSVIGRSETDGYSVEHTSQRRNPYGWFPAPSGVCPQVRAGDFARLLFVSGGGGRAATCAGAADVRRACAALRA